MSIQKSSNPLACLMNATPVSRRSVLLGASLLGAATLAGCGPSGVGEKDTKDSKDTGGTLGIEGERTGKELVLHLSAGHDWDTYKNAIAEFEKEHDIKVTIQTFQWGDLQQKITADFLSGQPADLIEEPGGFWAVRFGTSGDVLPINDFLKGDTSFLDEFVEAGIDVRSENGVTYAVPLHVTMGGLIFANQDMLDSAGVTMPTTWEEFVDVAKAIQDSGVEYGCALNNDNSYGHPWLLQNGVKFHEDPEAVLAPVDAAIEAYTAQQDIIYKHKLAPVPVASNEYSAPRKLFTTNRAGLIITGPWDIGAIRTENPDFPLAVGMPLKHNEHKTNIAGSGLMIPAKSQNAELAFELIKALTAPEVQEDLTKTTGMACSRKSWAESDTVKNDPILTTVAEARQIADSLDRVFFNNMNIAKIGEAHKAAYENIILNGEDPATHVNAFNELVAQYVE
ncbi:MAG: sugar ABC transporter substrate-binding protein [Actinomycetaceae bacterium]|nr:sugar ABC transporter substrate-binding protein [Actinomycetaceae bacterium]